MCLTFVPKYLSGPNCSKLKIFIIACIVFGTYILVFNDSFAIKKWDLIVSNNRDSTVHGHRIGDAIVNSNGTLIYFHLPKLDDYKIGDDYFELKSIHFSKYCLKKGSKTIQSNLIGSPTCICKQNFHGAECSIPNIVSDVIKNNKLNIERLAKPRRILMSLILISKMLTNQTEVQTRLAELYRVLDELSSFIDMFVIHEVKFTNETISNSSLNYLFEHGIFNKFKSLTLMKTTNFDPKKVDKNSEHLEFELMKQSWNVFSTQVTEYRPQDLLILMSINQVPELDLVLFLKYHTAIYDVAHLNPVYNFEYFNKLEPVYFSDQKPKNQAAQMLMHTRNIILSFQYISLLCQFNYERFILDYCLNNNEQLLEHFRSNFWPIRQLQIGSQEFHATKVIM